MRAATDRAANKTYKDAEFVAEFDGAQTPLIGVKANEGTGDPSEVDMITGATISSRTVIGTINNRLESLATAIASHAASGPTAPEAPPDSSAAPAAAVAVEGGEGT